MMLAWQLSRVGRLGLTSTAFAHGFSVERLYGSILRLQLRCGSLVLECHIGRSWHEECVHSRVSLEILNRHSLLIKLCGFVSTKRPLVLGEPNQPVNPHWLLDGSAVKMSVGTDAKFHTRATER